MFSKNFTEKYLCFDQWLMINDSWPMTHDQTAKTNDQSPNTRRQTKNISNETWIFFFFMSHEILVAVFSQRRELTMTKMMVAATAAESFLIIFIYVTPHKSLMLWYRKKSFNLQTISSIWRQNWFKRFNQFTPNLINLTL